MINFFSLHKARPDGEMYGIDGNHPREKIKEINK
jgi:hypothetical protein